MMLPTTLLAQTVKLTVKATLTVKDQHGASRSIDINPADAERYFRISACAQGDATASAATTEETAAEFLHHVQTRLNNGVSAVWVVSLQTDGFVKIQYTGTGLGQITWDSGNTVRNILGFTGSATSNLGTNAYTVGSYQPGHVLFVVGRSTESHWRTNAAHITAFETRGGIVDAVIGGSSVEELSFDSELHPTNTTYQSSLAVYSTPIDTTGRNSRTVNLDAGGLAPPWSAKDFFNVARGSVIGALIGTFQTRLTGSTTTYDLCTISAKTQAEMQLREQSFLGAQRIKGIVLRRRTPEVSL